ncbi:expressed unknown protein [Seminavis robusta]|uniref:F5/8 type C domain-containing protein n=1 Tax=Seminavis robusta TaxID=568900 RepID=A0A9N8HI87_9STRA|nr:expressed unknown protein [Seminavis robusta]|eukprot:Sro486_g152670.1 n/a (504) ;mRNA; r:39689-41486
MRNSMSLLLLVCMGAFLVLATADPDVTMSQENAAATKAVPLSNQHIHTNKRRHNRRRRRKLDEDEPDLSAIDTDGAEVSHSDGSMWVGEVENVLDGDLETTLSSAMQGDCINPTVVPTVTIDLGLGNDAFLEEIIVYHKQDGSKYCNQQVSVSVDGDNWEQVYSTRSGFGPEEEGDGVSAKFLRTRVRYVQVQSGASDKDEKAYFGEIVMKGLDRRTRPRVSVSENGKYVYATVNNEVWKMSGITADGSWEKVEGDKELQHAEVTNDNTLAAVVKSGSIFVGKTEDWGPSRGKLKTVDMAGDGSMVIGSQENTDIYWSKLEDGQIKWKKLNAQAQDTMANADGSLFMLVTPNEPHIHALQTRKLEDDLNAEPTKLELPEDIKVLQASFGGRHEVWLVDTEYELWHAYLVDHESDGPRFKHDSFKKMEIRVLSASATGNGAVFGAALDGTGVIYCRHRDFERFAQQCEYLRGPWGRTPDRSYSPRQSQPTRSQGAKLTLNSLVP